MPLFIKNGRISKFPQTAVYFSRMKKITTIWLITSFVAIAVFGFVGMGHGAEHDNRSGCLATTATGGNCPRESTPLGDFNFYLTVFRSFSLATPTMGNAALLLLVLTLSFAFALVVSHSPILAPAPGINQKRKFPEPLLCQLRLRRWLALRERGDAVLF